MYFSLCLQCRGGSVDLGSTNRRRNAQLSPKVRPVRCCALGRPNFEEFRSKLGPTQISKRLSRNLDPGQSEKPVSTTRKESWRFSQVLRMFPTCPITARIMPNIENLGIWHRDLARKGGQKGKWSNRAFSTKVNKAPKKQQMFSPQKLKLFTVLTWFDPTHARTG